jgi:hypothetical protein
MFPIGPDTRLPGQVIRIAAGLVPATIASVVAMLICLVALFLPERKQAYALRVLDGITDLVRVLVGASPKRRSFGARPSNNDQVH